MQFNLLTNQGYFFSSYNQDSVIIVKKNDEGIEQFEKEYSSNIVISHNKILEYNYNSLDDFSLYDEIKEYGIDLVIFGINDYSKLYHHPTLLKLNQLRIGYELMTIPATCKSFNYLSAEDRNPLAVIFFTYITNND
jgi:uncharacterized protein